MIHPSFHAQRTPDKIAYQMAETGEALTFAQLEARSNQAAHGLRKIGIGVGDHITFLLENRLEMMVLIWAAQRSGIVFTPISRYLKHEEAAFIVQDCGARAFITSNSYGDLGQGMRASFDADISCLMMDAVQDGFSSWDDLVADMPNTPVEDQRAGTAMLYSSGTTGRPKGILREQKNTNLDSLSPVLIAVCRDLGGMSDQSIYLSPAPLYHSAPLAAATVAAGLGATTIIMAKFDEEQMLREIQKHKVTHVQVVPTMFVRLMKLPKATHELYDVSSLEAALHVAAPCPVQIKHQMIEWWGPILLEYYAGSEGNGVTAAKSDEWLQNPGTVGRSLYGTVHILDDDGNELPTGEIGDVYFNSGFGFIYHNDEAKTEAAFTKDGWSTLGDIGWMNGDGYLFLTDRRAYTIISGGVNIYPQETEDLLITHPTITDVAVFGVPNEELGEEVKAVVQPVDFETAGSNLEAELIAFCRDNLSALKCPKSIDFQKELPRTPTGKLMKRHLKDAYWGKT